MRYKLPGAPAAALLLLFLIACGGTSIAPSKSPTGTAGSAVNSGPTVYVLATELVRSQPTEQVSAVQQGKPLWTFTLPAVGSVLILAGPTLYVGAGNSVFAISTANGQKRWAATTPGPRISAIQVHGDALFVAAGLSGGAGQQLVVLDAGDGSQRWSLAAPLGIGGWLIDGEVLYAVETGFPAQLVAADVTSGKITWQQSLPSGVVSGAVTDILPGDASSVVLVSQQSIALISTSSGAVMWLRQNSHNLGTLVQTGAIFSFYVDTPTAFGSPTIGLRALNLSNGSVLWDQPLASDDAAYLSYQSTLTIGAIAQNAYLIDGPQFTNAQAWNLSGQALWKATGTDTFTVLAPGKEAVYLASGSGVTALDNATGKQDWHVPGPGDITSMTATNGNIFGVSKPNTSLYALSASTGQLIWTYKAYQFHGYVVAAD